MLKKLQEMWTASMIYIKYNNYIILYIYPTECTLIHKGRFTARFLKLKPQKPLSVAKVKIRESDTDLILDQAHTEVSLSVGHQLQSRSQREKLCQENRKHNKASTYL